MAEPEDVIIEAAYHATSAARRLWLTAAAQAPVLQLNEVRRRLRCLIAMLFEQPPEIGAAEPRAPWSLLRRLSGGMPPAHLRSPIPLPSTDGVLIRLPPSLRGTAPEHAAAGYRLLALEQAARAQRGTPWWMPTGAGVLRDLYLLAEAAAVDQLLAEIAPGLACEIVSARLTERSARPERGYTAQEAELERLTRALLEAEPSKPPSSVPLFATPTDSLEWARLEAVRVAAVRGRYRGVAPVFLWGLPSPAGETLDRVHLKQFHHDKQRPEVHQLTRRPRTRTASEDEDDPGTGIWLPRADDPQESVEDPAGLQRPVDTDEYAGAEDLADSLSELPEARIVVSSDPVREVLTVDDPSLRRAIVISAPHDGGTALFYPEWDWRSRSYRLRGAVVRERAAAAADPSWSLVVRRRHASLIRRVRRDFERLRPRRQVLRGQRDGSDVDLDAYVVSAADRLAGRPTDDRLYLEERRVRPDSAVLILVDASGSTDSWVAGNRRVIDVEKEALLIVSEALARTGQRHSLFAFRGEGPERVELLPIKRFRETEREEVVGQRIGGLEPDGYTRVGAAVRHATALLAREPARHRLLLLLSDGRPNDVDLYEGRYGLEDTRQALIETRLQGIRPFCVTIDREAPGYAGHVFGRGDYALLHHSERLPEVLAAVLRRLL